MIDLRRGDVFCTANPHGLGSIIVAIEKFYARDGMATYSHAGIILDTMGTTFEALSTIRRQDLFEAYQGEQVLIGRCEMNIKSYRRGFLTIADHEHEWYPAHRLLLFLVPPLARMINFDFGVCSELTAKFLYGAGKLDFWSGVMPDDLADIIHRWKGWQIVFEGQL